MWWIVAISIDSNDSFVCYQLLCRLSIVFVSQLFDSFNSHDSIVYYGFLCHLSIALYLFDYIAAAPLYFFLQCIALHDQSFNSNLGRDWLTFRWQNVDPFAAFSFAPSSTRSSPVALEIWDWEISLSPSRSLTRSPHEFQVATWRTSANTRNATHSLATLEVWPDFAQGKVPSSQAAGWAWACDLATWEL